MFVVEVNHIVGLSAEMSATLSLSNILQYENDNIETAAFHTKHFRPQVTASFVQGFSLSDIGLHFSSKWPCSQSPLDVRNKITYGTENCQVPCLLKSIFSSNSQCYCFLFMLYYVYASSELSSAAFEPCAFPLTYLDA